MNDRLIELAGASVGALAGALETLESWAVVWHHVGGTQKCAYCEGVWVVNRRRHKGDCPFDVLDRLGLRELVAREEVG